LLSSIVASLSSDDFYLARHSLGLNTLPLLSLVSYILEVLYTFSYFFCNFTKMLVQVTFSKVGSCINTNTLIIVK
jgi:hypothetical protein